MAFGAYLLTLSIAAATSYLFLGQIIRLFCSIIGSNLCSRTASRRQLLLDRAKAEEQELARRDAEGTKSQLDGEWEKVESSSTPSSGNGEKASGDYEEVIGFFHPFWLAAKSRTGVRQVDKAIAMLEVVVSVFYGLQYGQHNNGIPRRFAWCILEITTWTETQCWRLSRTGSTSICMPRV